jgi:hypothetical protein
LNNQLEGFYFRQEEINKIFSEAGVHYDTDKIKQSTVSAWANSNLSIEQIEFLLKNADTKITEDIKTKRDLKEAMEKEQLRKGVITK